MHPSSIIERVRRLLPALLALAAASAVHADVLVSTLDGGPPARGLSLKVSGGRLSFQSPEGKVLQIPAADVVEVVTVPAPVRPPKKTHPFEVELTCGSRIRGQLGAAPEDVCKIRSQIVGQLSISIDHLRGIRRADGRTTPGTAQLVRIPDRDAGYRIDGGRVEGVLTLFAPNGIRIDRGGNFGERTIRYRELAALYIDNPQTPTPQGLHLIARLSSGDAIVLVQGFSIEGGVLRGETPTGIAIRVPVQHVAALTFQGGRFVYLSDKEPQRVERKPFFPLPESPAKPAMLEFVCPVRKDLSPDGSPITLKKRRYFKGIGVRPYTAMTFELDGSYRFFEARCGIDDEVLGPGYGRSGGTGSVVFRIDVDGKKAYETGIVRGGADPVRVRVPIDGAKTITLIVQLVPAAKMPKGVADSPALDNAVWARPLLIR